MFDHRHRERDRTFRPFAMTEPRVQIEEAEDEDTEDSDFEDDLEFYIEPKPGPNCQTQNSTKESAEELSRKFSGKISVDKYEGAGLLSEAANKLISSNKKATANR